MRWAALLGNPIGHTLSPLIHNMAFEQLGIDGMYLPIQVEDEYLEEVLSGLCFMENLMGFNITIPFKELAVQFMDMSEREVELIGAVNTVKRGGKKLIGYNTDWLGFLKALDRAWGEELEGKSVLVLGGGGAARAVVYALHTRKVQKVSLALRSQAKRAQMKNRLPWIFLETVPFEREAIEKALPQTDLLVNATPLGLKGEPVPFSLSGMKRDGFVMDLIYNPPVTPLLQDAQAVGIKSSNGLFMLLYQALESFKIWTGKEPASLPIEERLLEWEAGILLK